MNKIMCEDYLELIEEDERSMTPSSVDPIRERERRRRRPEGERAPPSTKTEYELCLKGATCTYL